MRNIWKIAFIILLCVMLVGIAVSALVVAIFHDPGIHVLGSLAHISYRENCYFIDPETKEILGQGEFYASGYNFNSGFAGLININAYPLSPDDLNGHISFRRINPDLVLFSGYDVVTSANFLGTEWSRYYDVWVCPQNTDAQPKAVVIDIFENGKPKMIAVCAESEEDVWTNYGIYKEYLGK